MSTWTTWRVVAVAIIILASGALAIFAAKNSLADNPGCIAGLAEVATAAATPSATDESGITTNLFVVTDSGSAPQLVRTLSVQAPVDSSQAAKIRGLLATSPAKLRSELGNNFESQNEYRDALLNIIGPKSGKPQAFPSSVAKDLLKEVGVLPTVVVADGIAKLTIVLPPDRFLTSYFSGDASGDTIAQPWKANSDGRDITLGIQSLGTGTAWRVGFCVDGMQILAAQPQPDTMDGNGFLTWAFPADRSTASSVNVTLRPDYPTALRLWILNRAGRTAALIWVYLSPILVLAIGLLLVPRKGATTTPVFSARQRLASLTYAACLLAGAGTLALLIPTRLQSGQDTTSAVAIGVISYAGVSLAALSFRARLETGLRFVAERLVPALPVFAAVAWMFVYARAQNLGPEHLGEALPRTLAASGYAAFFSSAVLMRTARSDREISLVLRVALIANVIAGLVLCTPIWSSLAIFVPIWITANFAFGFALFLVGLLPLPLWRRIPKAVRAPAWILTTSFIVLAVIAQWVWATYKSQSIWWRAPLESDPACFLSGLRDHLTHQPLKAESACAFPIELAAGFYQSLSNLLMGYPQMFLGAATSLLPLLGLAGLIGILSAAGRSARLPVWGKANQWVGREIAFLFLIFVVGYGGEAFGFRLPLALVFAIGLLKLALTDRIGEAMAWIAERNAGGSTTGTRKNQPQILAIRRELLNRAKDLAALEQQRSDAFATYENDADAYYKAVSDLDAKSAHLRDGGDGLVLLPPGFEPGELALALGPARRWWSRGITAVHQGMRIAWLPIAYFLYVLLLGQAQSLAASPVPLSLVSLGAAVANELVFWLTAAFTFGCLFPLLRGQNGLVKGFVLGGVYLGAHAGASVFGVAGDTLWPVRSFQLLLYLMILGIMLDASTVEDESLSWQYLLGRYKVHEAQTAVSYALSFITLLTIVGKQLVSNEAANAITTVIASQEQVSTIVNAITPLLPPMG